MSDGNQHGRPANEAREADEKQLLDGLRARDPKAFERFVRGHGPTALGIARRILPTDEDAQECLQEAFLSAWRAIDSFEGRSKLSTWLHRIVTNAALMRLRARASRPEVLTDSEETLYDRFGFREGPHRANSLTPEELGTRRQTRSIVLRAIDELPESYRQIIAIRDLEGHSTAETAEQLGISTTAVKTRLHRARTRLREALQPLFEEDLR